MGTAAGKPGNKITGVCVVLLPPLFFCAGTAGTAGTPHKQGLAAVPALFEQRGQRGQKQGYPQQKMCYPLILLNKQAIQNGRSNSGHPVKLDLNSSPLPSGRRFAAVGTGTPHRAGRGHQQPHQINTAQRRLIRAGAGLDRAGVSNGGRRYLPYLVQGPCPQICSAKGVPARPLIGGPPVQARPGFAAQHQAKGWAPWALDHTTGPDSSASTGQQRPGTVGAANCLKGQGRRLPG
jgi:hypothetical protein